MTANVHHQASLPPNSDLDDLLRSYYKAELRHPWPSCPQPELRRNRVAAAPPIWLTPMTRSRLALAASLALIITGSLFVAGNLSLPADNARDLLRPYSSDRAEKPSLPVNNYLQSDNLLQKSDGTYYQIEFFELPPEKPKSTTPD